MKLFTYKQNNAQLIGVLAKDEKTFESLKDHNVSYKTMNDLIANITPEEKALLLKASNLTNGHYALDSIELLAPIPCPKQDIICLGINFLDHAKESARFKKETFEKERSIAVYFSKRVAYATGPSGIIPAHDNIVDSLDYEAELAVVIGRETRNVKPADVYDHIFGYTVMNDVSARNLQTRHKQWYFGKSLDGFSPMGPFLVTEDEFRRPPHLGISSKVNGELRQNSNTSLFITSIENAVSELSAGMTLYPGSIISMGTPAGVGMGFTPPKFLNPGDVIECSVEGIGSIVNKVK